MFPNQSELVNCFRGISDKASYRAQVSLTVAELRLRASQRSLTGQRPKLYSAAVSLQTQTEDHADSAT